MKIGMENTDQTMPAIVSHVPLDKENMPEDEDWAVDFEGSSHSFDSATSSWEDSDDESLMEMEERLHEFSHIGSTPALAAMVFDTKEFKLALPRSRGRDDDDGSVMSGKLSVASTNKLLSRPQLTPSAQKSLTSFSIRRSNSDQFIQKVSYTAKKPEEENEEEDMKPEACVKEILKEKGIDMPDFSKELSESFLLEMIDENFAAYGRDIAAAVRTGDLEAVKQHFLSGKTLQCCNKFRESVVHIVCRRGHEDVLRYMLEESDVSPCIQDDLGRTPMHELAWTNVPNFEMVKMILTRNPDLLYVKDNRGSTPLSFVGRNNWKKWCDFLEANRDVLVPNNI